MNKKLLVKRCVVPLVLFVLFLTVLPPQKAQAQSVYVGQQGEQSMSFTIGDNVSFWWEGFPQPENGWFLNQQTEHFYYCVSESSSPPQEESAWAEIEGNNRSIENLYHPMQAETVYYIHIRQLILEEVDVGPIFSGTTEVISTTYACAHFTCYKIPVQFIDEHNNLETEHTFFNNTGQGSVYTNPNSFRVSFKTFNDPNILKPESCQITGYELLIAPAPPPKAGNTASFNSINVGNHASVTCEQIPEPQDIQNGADYYAAVRVTYTYNGRQYKSCCHSSENCRAIIAGVQVKGLRITTRPSDTAKRATDVTVVWDSIDTGGGTIRGLWVALGSSRLSEDIETFTSVTPTSSTSHTFYGVHNSALTSPFYAILKVRCGNKEICFCVQSSRVYIGKLNERGMNFCIGDRVSFWWEGFKTYPEGEVESYHYYYCVSESSNPLSAANWVRASEEIVQSQAVEDFCCQITAAQIYYVHVKQIGVEETIFGGENEIGPTTYVSTQFFCHKIPISFVDNDNNVETSHIFAKDDNDPKFKIKIDWPLANTLPGNCIIDDSNCYLHIKAAPPPDKDRTLTAPGTKITGRPATLYQAADPQEIVNQAVYYPTLAVQYQYGTYSRTNTYWGCCYGKGCRAIKESDINVVNLRVEPLPTTTGSQFNGRITVCWNPIEIPDGIDITKIEAALGDRPGSGDIAPFQTILPTTSTTTHFNRVTINDISKPYYATLRVSYNSGGSKYTITYSTPFNVLFEVATTINVGGFANVDLGFTVGDSVTIRFDSHNSNTDGYYYYIGPEPNAPMPVLGASEGGNWSYVKLSSPVTVRPPTDVCVNDICFAHKKPLCDEAVYWVHVSPKINGNPCAVSTKSFTVLQAYTEFCTNGTPPRHPLLTKTFDDARGNFEVWCEDIYNKITSHIPPAQGRIEVPWAGVKYAAAAKANTYASLQNDLNCFGTPLMAYPINNYVISGEVAPIIDQAHYYASLYVQYMIENDTPTTYNTCCYSGNCSGEASCTAILKAPASITLQVEPIPEQDWQTVSSYKGPVKVNFSIKELFSDSFSAIGAMKLMIGKEPGTDNFGTRVTISPGYDNHRPHDVQDFSFEFVNSSSPSGNTLGLMLGKQYYATLQIEARRTDNTVYRYTLARAFTVPYKMSFNLSVGHKPTTTPFFLGGRVWAFWELVTPPPPNTQITYQYYIGSKQDSDRITADEWVDAGFNTQFEGKPSTSNEIMGQQKYYVHLRPIINGNPAGAKCLRGQFENFMPEVSIEDGGQIGAPASFTVLFNLNVSETDFTGIGALLQKRGYIRYEAAIASCPMSLLRPPEEIPEGLSFKQMRYNSQIELPASFRCHIDDDSVITDLNHKYYVIFKITYVYDGSEYYGYCHSPFYGESESSALPDLPGAIFYSLEPSTLNSDFYNNPNLDTRLEQGEYILSAYAAPCSGTLSIGLGLYDSNQTRLATYSITLASSGRIIETSPTISSYGITDVITNSGILDDEGQELTFYRIYMKFNCRSENTNASQAFVILRSKEFDNSDPSSPIYYASYFEGIQLERAYKGQDRPASYHPIYTISSPNRQKSIHGDKFLYEK